KYTNILQLCKLLLYSILFSLFPVHYHLSHFAAIHTFLANLFHLSQIFASYPERLLLRAEWLYCDILYTFYYASEVLMPRLHRSGKLIPSILLTVLTLLGAAFLL